MKLLVTGANGFIGKSLIHALKERKIHVVGATRQLLSSKTEGLFSVPDFAAKDVWSGFLKDCDVIIHLAARAHKTNEKPDDSLEEYMEANVKGTLNLAEEAIRAGVKRFVYVSSIGVHGENTFSEPLTESSPISPKSNYTKSKWLAEQGLIQLCSNSCIELVILRPPLVFGPENPGNMLKLINLVNICIPLPLKSIKNSRSLIYLGNLIDALILCAIHPRASNQTYLVSDGEDISTTQLLRKIAKLLNKRSILFPFPLFIMRFLTKLIKKSNTLDKLTQSLVIDSSKIRQDLDWKPPFTIDQGLKETADWYLKSLENPRP